MAIWDASGLTEDTFAILAETPNFQRNLKQLTLILCSTLHLDWLSEHPALETLEVGPDSPELQAKVDALKLKGPRFQVVVKPASPWSMGFK